MNDGLFVENRNDFFHTDAYNGETYEFPPGEKVYVSKDAATHMFGFGKKVKTDNLLRLGWAGSVAHNDSDSGMVLLRKFVFTEAFVQSKDSGVVLKEKHQVQRPVDTSPPPNPADMVELHERKKKRSVAETMSSDLGL